MVPERQIGQREDSCKPELRTRELSMSEYRIKLVSLKSSGDIRPPRLEQTLGQPTWEELGSDLDHQEPSNKCL